MESEDGKTDGLAAEVLCSNRPSDPVWYCQLDESIVGPLSVTQLQEHLSNDVIDGMTFCWKEGMAEWRQIFDVEALKVHLAAKQDPEQEPTAARSDAGARRACPAAAARLPLETVPEQLKYITAEGVGQVFDTATQQWLTFSEYRALTGSEPAAPPANAADKGAACEKEAAVPGVPESDLVDLDAKRQRNVESRRKYRERVKEKKKAGIWVKPKTNPNVYVKGLPPDVTEEELADVFRRAGVIKIDPDTSRPKIRIYRRPDGLVNGDATISFVNAESVNLAIKYLDGSFFRNDCTLHVEQAQFQKAEKMAGQAVNPREREMQRKKYWAAKLEEQRLLGWSDGMSDGRMRIMLIRPLWSYQEAEEYPFNDAFYSTIAVNLKESLSEWTSVVSVTPIERHPRGIACVKFRTAEDCEAAILRLNQRPYRHLGLPEREVDLTRKMFLEWDQSSNSHQPLCYEARSSCIDALNVQELDLLRRVDVSLEAAASKRKAADASSYRTVEPLAQVKRLRRTTGDEVALGIMGNALTAARSCPKANGSDLLNFHDDGEQLPPVSQPKRQRPLSPDALDEDPAVGERPFRRERLAYFISTRGLLIDAYIYDGKTDLKGQALPMDQQQPEPVLEAAPENAEDQRTTDGVLTTTEDAEYPDTAPFSGLPETKEPPLSWDEWLDEEDSSDDDATYIIRTEK